MTIVKTYESFNFRRYGNPWIAEVNENGKINFNKQIGGYTGGYKKGESGVLYVNNPVENKVYAFGQKDYRGNNGGYGYIVFINGEFFPVNKNELSKYL